MCPFAQWLEGEFLPYLDAWEKSLKEQEGFSDAQKKRMTEQRDTPWTAYYRSVWITSL